MFEVRGGVKTDGVTTLLKNGSEGGGGGAFAVGAGDEDGWEAPVRIAESLKQDAHVGEIEFTPWCAGREWGKFTAEGE